MRAKITANLQRMAVDRKGKFMKGSVKWLRSQFHPRGVLLNKGWRKELKHSPDMAGAVASAIRVMHPIYAGTMSGKKGARKQMQARAGNRNAAMLFRLGAMSGRNY